MDLTESSFTRWEKGIKTMGIQRRIYDGKGNHRSCQHLKSISSIVIEFDNVHRYIPAINKTNEIMKIVRVGLRDTT